MTSHLIRGRRVGTPVRIRDAMACAAVYLVRAEAARAVLAYSGLDAVEVLPGRAVCTLAFAQYRDGDLGAYHEFAMAFLARPPGGGSGRRGALSVLRDLRSAGAIVHWMPVDEEFTFEAGRAIWGFPKELATIDLRLSGPYKRCVLKKDGRLVLDMLVRPGIPVPDPPIGWPWLTAPVAFTHLDGVTRRVPWSFRARGVRLRPGGALIRLGNHPIAKELSELGLPKHAFLTVTFGGLSLSIEEPLPA